MTTLDLVSTKVFSRLIPVVGLVLSCDPDGTPVNETWYYRFVLENITYLAYSIRPDISMVAY